MARCQRGNVVMGFALGAAALVMAAGASVDYAALKGHKTALQSAVDAAALAAVKEFALANADAASISALASSYVEANLSGHDNLSVNATIIPGENSVRVDVGWDYESLFPVLHPDGNRHLTASATARTVGKGVVCLIGLDRNKKETVYLRARASLAASGCGVFSNSKNKEAIKVEDNAKLEAALTCSAGGIKGAKHSSFSPDPVTDCPQIDDPLSARIPPPIGACDYNDTQIENVTVTLSPGTYCGGLKVKGTARVKLRPGVYVIKDDKLEVTDKAEFTGEFVGFYLAGSKAKLSFKKETTIALTAPNDGVMAGLLIFEDRNAAKIEKHEITSDNARTLLGTIYLPNGTLRIDSEAPVSDKSAYTAIIARTVELDEGPTLHLNSDYHATEVPLPPGLMGGMSYVSR